uniref:Ig-like domain-containing protein n=1 Tax=Timema tahoe TaxID=61484 RepID=A0A7R9FKA6_9NEOP|nr:unnamed protein product [Timema tahoe]
MQLKRLKQRRLERKLKLLLRRKGEHSKRLGGQLRPKEAAAEKARKEVEAANEARKAAEAASIALQETQILLEKTVQVNLEKLEIQRTEAYPLPPSEPEPEKPPTPPPKKKLIDVAPVFTLPLCDAIIQEGDKFIFECRVTGVPKPEVTWYKDGIFIQNNPDYLTTCHDGLCRLTIEETFAEDSARFTCKAVNAAGIAETNALLSVKETEPDEQLSPPVFVKFLESGAAKEGTTHQLHCKVEGVPLPLVQWFKNDTCIDNSPDYVITYNNGDAVLRFEEVFLEDQAEYTCKATNPVGTDTCKARLTVEPLEPTESPAFVTPLSNVMARAGQKIKLECEVTGLPMPELSWIQNGKPVKETRDLKTQYDEDFKATLTITEAFPKDAGVYVVSAKNIAGEATSSCNVSVKGRLPTETSDSELASDMEPIKPAIQLPLKDICVFEGKKVRLDCVIIGQPEPEVIWYHDDHPVKESNDFKLLFQGDRCSLVIEEVYLEDSGEYKVVAINSAGEASSKCDLTIKSVGETEPATRQQPTEKTVEEPLTSGMAPRFTKLLTDILATEGDQVVLECCVGGDPHPDIRWFLNNHEIVSTDGIQYAEDDQGNVSLTIVSVSPSHKGVYTVKASNASGEAKCFANLIVKPAVSSTERPEVQHQEEKMVIPAFKELFADRAVVEQGPTKFECIVTGKPTPKVHWHFNDKPVSGKDFLVSTSGERQVLTIHQVAKEHAGKVACIAENEAGRATCVATLSVLEGHPKDMNLAPLIESSTVSEKSESYTMKRSVFVQSSSNQVSSSSAEPNVEVHSYSSHADHLLRKVGEKPPVEVRNEKSEEFHQVNRDKPSVHTHQSLLITNGQREDSMTSGSSTPVSSPRPIRKSIPPRFVTPLVGRIVDQGADVTLIGIIDGYPTPTVVWTKNDQELSPKEGSISMSWELNKVTLELTKVGVKDAGRYTCKATNPVGSATSTADLVVKKTVFPPVFGRRLQAQMVKSGERVVMEVEATGTPDPTVSWYKDDIKILGAVPGGKFRTKIQGNCYTLIIEKATPEYSGKYTVKAVNSAGEAQSIADFLVLEPQVDQTVVTHMIVQNVVHSSTQKHDKDESIISSTEEAPPQPTLSPEQVKPPTKQETPRSSPAFGKPVTSESLTFTETTKTEKHISVRMERTPSPSYYTPRESPIPVTKEEIVTPVTKNKPTPPATKIEFAPFKEMVIPIKIEERKEERVPVPQKEVEIPIQVDQKTFTEIVNSLTDLSSIYDHVSKKKETVEILPQKPIKPEEDTGIESESISKKSALDFFINKLNEDDLKQKQEDVLTGASTTVTNIKSQFEELHLKEEKTLQKPEPISIHFSHEIKQDAPKLQPAEAQQLPPFPQKEQRSSYTSSEYQRETQGPPSQFTSVAETAQTKHPYETVSKSEFHTEHISSTKFEKRVSHHSATSSSLEEFNLQPEPPPEMGFIPKSEVPSKLRLDMPSRVKQLEESHRVLSPVEIPSGAIRIFPTPARVGIPPAVNSESIKVHPTVEPANKPEVPTVYSKPQQETVLPPWKQPEQKPVEVQEEVAQKEVVEEVFVQKKIHLPGTGDWSYRPTPAPPQTQEKVPVSSKPWAPFKPVEVTQPAKPVLIPKPEPSTRPISPKPSAEGIAMERLWAPLRTPEPEPVSLPPPEPIIRPTTPKPPTDEYKPTFLRTVSSRPSVETVTSEKLTSSHMRSFTSESTSAFSPVQARAVSPRPSAEGIQMEKLWTPQKPPEPEHGIQRPVSTGPYRATSPKPSMEGLAMDKIWAHKHPDSALKKTWPPPQPSEEKPVVPWATKEEVEKSWPPPPIESEVSVTKKVDEKNYFVETKHTKTQLDSIQPPPGVKPTEKSLVKPVEKPVIKPIERVWAPVQPEVARHTFEEKTQKVQQPPPQPRPVEKVWQQVQPGFTSVSQKSEERIHSVEIKDQPALDPQTKMTPVPKPASPFTVIRQETEDISKSYVHSSVETIEKPIIPPQNVIHYIAEAKLLPSTVIFDKQSQSSDMITSSEITEVKSERSEFTSSEFHSVQTHGKEPSPPVVEERGLRPSEKSWPPGPKVDFELKAPPVRKDTSSRSASIQQVVQEEIYLEPGPPPEMGYAPPVPQGRRQSYVETIEQDLERSLEKEPTKHLVGSVRTMPPPPQREKSLTPAPTTPQKDRSFPPLFPKSTLPQPPLKDKLSEGKSVPKQVKKEPLKKPDVESKPFERFPDLEPFPFSPDPSKPKPSKGPPPPKPSKFVRGEFASSDYESDFESIQISSKWRPYESDTEEFSYKRVLPPSTTPQPRRPKSTEPEPLPPSKFDRPPQYEGPPRPSIDVSQFEKKHSKTEVTKITSKVEMKTDKIRKHTSETKKKYSPPTLKPESPPIICQADPPSPPKPEEKSKPDSPKSKTKNARPVQPQQESGYMADTEEPRRIRQAMHQKNIKHEESTKTTVEHTTVISERFSQQSSQQTSVQRQQNVVSQEKVATSKPQFKSHHRHSEQKVEKKVAIASTGSIKSKKEIVVPSMVKEVPGTTTQTYSEDRSSSLEPLPFKAEPTRSVPKRSLGPPPPSPSKFVRGEFRESDYESDYEGRIPALWRPLDSDADGPSYKPVRPVLTPGGSRQHSRASMEVRTPTPPTEFDNPPQFGGPPRPKFEPIDKLLPAKQSKNLKMPEKPQVIVKPKPKLVAPKSPPLELIIATPAVRKPFILKPGSPPEWGSAPPPGTTYHGHSKVSNFPNATQTETSKVMNFAESTEHSHRVVSVQQTTRVIKFGEKENRPPQGGAPLEPFPFKPEPEKPRRRNSGPPPTMPKKFVPGEFRESDYESDYESMHIRPKWVPGDSDTDEPHYRKVKPPPVTRSTSVPGRSSTTRVPTPMEFDTEPPLLPATPVPRSSQVSSTTISSEHSAEQSRLRRVEEMRKRFSETTSSSTVQRSSQPSTPEAVLRPEDSPEFGFIGRKIPTSASFSCLLSATDLVFAGVQPNLYQDTQIPRYTTWAVASKHMNEMTSTFKSKAQKFVDDIITDVRTSKPDKQTQKSPTAAEVAPASTGDDPQAYREESRVSQYGTKHIDPETGLIYFKYDFGYEFGIVLPGEGKKPERDEKNAKRPRIDDKRSDDVEFPIIHETTQGVQKKAGAENKQAKEPEGKVPLFRPKKFTHSKAVKWEPMSESEMSEAEGDASGHKKRYSLPQPPHINIPGSTHWDQTTPSPVSLSPSLPSLSPRYLGGAQSVTPVPDLAEMNDEILIVYLQEYKYIYDQSDSRYMNNVRRLNIWEEIENKINVLVSPGGSWQGISPMKGPNKGQGRGGTPTPPSTPSSLGGLPRKPPTFITPLRDIAVVSGQTARFECIVQAEPPPNVLWSKNGRIIENCQDYQIQYRNGVCRLTIPQAFPEDAGNYTCTATNMLGTIGSSGTLQVPGERRSVRKP